jgi:hypothetical protein
MRGAGLAGARAIAHWSTAFGAVSASGIGLARLALTAETPAGKEPAA